jgi:hypothetical protein
MKSFYVCADGCSLQDWNLECQESWIGGAVSSPRKVQRPRSHLHCACSTGIRAESYLALNASLDTRDAPPSVWPESPPPVG